MFKVFPTAESIAKEASDLLVKTIQQKPTAHLGLATGSTMEPVYATFVAQARSIQLNTAELTTFNLDEYIGLSGDHPQSYWYFMQQHLFAPLNMRGSQSHLPCGKSSNLEFECEQYTQKIKANGGLDLQLLGIGSNGHIGFNEPGTPFQSRTHVVELTEKTRRDNSRFFDNIDEMPTHAITMGLQDIMDAKQVVLIATGEHKAQVMAKLYESEVTPDMPASVLKNHPKVHIWVDEAAASLLPKSIPRCA